MKKEINTLFALIRNAVFNEPLDEETKLEASEKAELLYGMSRHHDLAHLVEYAFLTNGIQAKDEQVAFKLIKQQAISVLRYENINLVIQKVSELFEIKQIPFILLKGAVMRAYYPEPWMRTSCDVDILVHEEDVENAKNLLVEKMGFVAKTEGNYHDISLFSDNDVHLELHFTIKENDEKIDVLLDKVWDYAKPKSENSFEYVMTDEFFLFHHVAHMSYHVVNGGCSIRYFIDLYLLEHKLGVDKDVLFDMLTLCGIKHFYDVILCLSDVWFSTGCHNETTVALQKYLLDGGVYGTKKNAIAANSQKTNTVSYIFGRLFMPYEQLCLKYPGLKGKPFLVPFYQIKRWCGAFSGNGASNTYKGLKINNSIMDDEIERSSGVLRELGLKN